MEVLAKPDEAIGSDNACFLIGEAIPFHGKPGFELDECWPGGELEEFQIGTLSDGCEEGDADIANGEFVWEGGLSDL